MTQFLPLPIWIEYIILGMFGALACYLSQQIREPEEKWRIVLPSIKDNKLYLGILMYLILGAAAGWLAPSMIGNSVNSFLAGFFFVQVFETLSRRYSSRLHV